MQSEENKNRNVYNVMGYDVNMMTLAIIVFLVVVVFLYLMMDNKRLVSQAGGNIVSGITDALSSTVSSIPELPF